MQRQHCLSYAIVLLATLFCLGCGNHSKSVVKQLIECTNELANAFESGDKNKIQSITNRVNTLMNEGNDKKVVTADSLQAKEQYRKELVQYEKEIIAAQTRMIEAYEKALSSGKLKKSDMVEIAAKMESITRRPPD